MKLVIKEVAHKYRDQYCVTIDFMHGDADADSDEKFYFDDKKEALKFVLELETIHLGTTPEENDDDELKVIGDWPMDSTSDGNCWASYEGYSITYFDKNGLEFTVALEK